MLAGSKVFLLLNVKNSATKGTVTDSLELAAPLSCAIRWYVSFSLPLSLVSFPIRKMESTNL